MVKLLSTTQELDILDQFVRLGVMPKSSIYEMIEHAIQDVEELARENNELHYALQLFYNAYTDKDERLLELAADYAREMKFIHEL